MFRSFMLVLVVGASCVLSEEREFYPSTYDGLDVTATLSNDRLREQYYACFMDTGPCLEASAKFYKEFFPEVITTQCRKCNNRQKEMFSEIAEWYSTNRPEDWNALVAKGLNDVKALKAAKGE